MFISTVSPGKNERTTLHPSDTKQANVQCMCFVHLYIMQIMLHQHDIMFMKVFCTLKIHVSLVIETDKEHPE